MNAQSKQFLQAALQLPESDRAEIAASLIRSLDSESDEDADTLWANEVGSRIQSIDKGEIKLIPWDEVISQMDRTKDEPSSD
jgi:putative addiction module component (TIGR02574 family)